MNRYSLEKKTKFKDEKVGDRQIRFFVEYKDQLSISANYPISSEKTMYMLLQKPTEKLKA